MVFQILNKLKWTRQLPHASVTILHRGAPGNKKTIQGKSITEVKRSYFLYEKNNSETFIPYRRVLEVKKGSKIWRRNERKTLGN